MRKRGICVLAALLLLSGCGFWPRTPAETPDPHEGMVLVADGRGTHMWVKEYEDVPVNPLRNIDIAASRDIMGEDGVHYRTRLGIDVSEHQGAVDWAVLAGHGMDFAILRAGYRGYGEAGTLNEDVCFADNLRGTQENGIDIGVYFFSQATNTAEAEEEADFLIGLLRSYAPENLTLPIFYDWEHIDDDTARTDDVPDETVTDCTVAFCERLREAGYDAGVYTFRFFAYQSYDLSRLKDYPLWIGAVGKNPDFYYEFDIWQRSVSGRFEGIEGKVDIDMIFVPVSSPAPQPESSVNKTE